MLYLVLGIICMFLLWKNLTGSSGPFPPDMPGRLPIIGHIHLLLCNTEDFMTKIQNLSKQCTEKGGMASAFMGPIRVYCMTDPEDILTICNNCFEKDQIYSFLKPLLGEGLVTGNAITWKRHRKLINPAFNQQVLNSFIGIFNSQARRLVDQLSTEVGKQVDQEYWLRLNNLETICLTSAGGNNVEYKTFQKTYLSYMPEFQSMAMARILNIILHPDIFYNMTNMKRKQDVMLKHMKKLSTTLITNKQLEYQNRSSVSGKCVPFMDLMIELANRTGCFTDEEISEETDNIIAGGHDTTANALTYVIAILGSYPDVQQKVYDEIISVVGMSKRDIDKDDLPKLVYMEAVLKETLRLYPIAPIIVRYIDKDMKLKNYSIKSKSRLIISLYGMNRHPVWGPDADEFRPERWLDLNTLPDQNNFGSFGVGRRACIGKMYAMMSMKISMAHLLLRYKLHSDITKLRLKCDVMLRVVSGHEVTLELRE